MSRYCFLALSLALVSLGCGGQSDRPELATVSGTVVKGKDPVANATVIFTPENTKAAAATGKTDTAGAYTLTYTAGLKGAPIGANRVKIIIGGNSEDESKPSPPPVMYLLEKPSNVAPGSNTADFDLAGLKATAE